MKSIIESPLPQSYPFGARELRKNITSTFKGEEAKNPFSLGGRRIG
jgi:hypothetical protein